ncbi:hypothetical protein DFQ27_002965 [Actinomortierella ambigua]|uniref:Phytanoyl-CoA dioxygenase n=1 Tax=Actinomortierella ambigua TaxID=1343610 RepID=A0A9P6U5H5_9FUNG|nr:hypothetical protein DFQ27_002965 [Actinomortierella ambigua]
METNAQSDNIHCTNFYRDGFVIIENVLSEEQKRVLHSECERLTNFVMDQGYDLMSELGGIIEPVNVGYEDPPETQTFVFNKRAYIRNRDKISTPDSLTNIIFGVVKDLVAKLLPKPTEDEPLCLFNEQYIVKMPRSVNESAFAWHQDTQYMDKHAQELYPVISCWIALDDVGPDNGTLLIEPLPFIINTQETISNIPQVSSYLEYFGLRADAYAPPLDTMEALDRSILSGTDGRQEEFVISSSDGSLQEEERPQSRYRTPVLVKIPAGSIVFLSGHVRHCSLGNPSPLFRRAYMPQYSIGPVFNRAGCLISLAVPCEDPAPLQVPPVFDDV